MSEGCTHDCSSCSSNCGERQNNPKDFIEKHGKTSWEVDALKPEVLNAILKQAIEENIDIDKFEEILAEEEADKEKLEELKNKL